MDRLRIRPRTNPGDTTSTLGFPKDFLILYAYNGKVDEIDGWARTCDPNDPRFGQIANWRPLVSRFGFVQPQSGWLSFDLPATVRKPECIRILGTELSQDDYGFRYLQLSEIEAYD